MLWSRGGRDERAGAEVDAVEAWREGEQTSAFYRFEYSRFRKKVSGASIVTLYNTPGERFRKNEHGQGHLRLVIGRTHNRIEPYDTGMRQNEHTNCDTHVGWVKLCSPPPCKRTVLQERLPGMLF